MGQLKTEKANLIIVLININFYHCTEVRLENVPDFRKYTQNEEWRGKGA